ncbi:hypothetical protein D3C85_656250 [compost metagenome]
MAAPVAILILPQHIHRQFMPFRVRVRTEAGGHVAHELGALLEGLETQVLADVIADALQGFGRQGRADIVQDQLADRAVRQRCQAQADQAAHRRAEPVHRLAFTVGQHARQQGHHVAHILRHAVELGIGQPARAPASHHVGADHAVITGHGARQVIEVVRHARHAVGADEHVRIIGSAPLLVRHGMQACGGDALHGFDARFDHAIPYNTGATVLSGVVIW